MTVSVFVTSYNQADLLQEAIDSVLQQTRQPDELIIADDASTDGSRDLIRSYQQEYPDLIRPILHDRNLGIPRNKNSAYRATTGDLVTYLDGDDRFFANKIEVDLGTFDAHPDADAVCANVAHVDADGNRTGVWCRDAEAVPTGDVTTDVLARTFPNRTIFRNEMVRRKRLAEVDFMDPQFAMYHDWELRIRLSRSARLAYTHEVTAEYRNNPAGVSASRPGRHLDECDRVYRKHRSLIECLRPESRHYVNRHLRPWIGRFAWRAVRDAMGRGDRASAWAYFVDGLTYAPADVDLRALAKMALPRRVVHGLRSLRS